MSKRSLDLARRELWMMLRQRETLVWVFVMPIVFFYFIGTVSGGFGTKRGATKDRIGLVSASDGGFLVDELERRLAKLDYDVVRGGGDEPEFPSLRLRVPAAFTANVLAGTQQQVTLVTSSSSSSAQFHEVRVARAVYGLLADLIASVDASGSVDPSGLGARADLPRKVTIAVSAAGKQKTIPEGFQQTVPGTMVMFTLIVLLTSGAVLLVIEREQGLLRRLASAPLSRGEVVFAKWLSRVALAAVQLGFAMLVGRLVFRVDWGPDLPMVLACLAGWAALCAALAILLGSLAKSTGQAVAIGVLSSNVLAALGGCWWPIEVVPRWMQKLALCLPTGWTMDALHRLMTFQNGAADAAGSLAMLCGAAVLAGWGATRAFRYQ
ncbi:MAG: ABC transporter permease [Planctomycetes bacterium]|nr:ABC transporter permease [Planctomycetota bacterium]